MSRISTLWQIYPSIAYLFYGLDLPQVQPRYQYRLADWLMAALPVLPVGLN